MRRNARTQHCVFVHKCVEYSNCQENNGTIAREVRVENKMHWKSQAYIKFGFWTKNYL